MSRITQVLNRRLRPFVLNTFRSLNGMPVPSGSVDVMTWESDSQACHIIEPEPLGKELISPRALSGDPILVEKTLEMIPDLAVQKQYVQELVGEKQINPKEFVCVLEQGRVAHASGLVMTPDNRVLEDVSCIKFDSDLPTNPLLLRYLPRPARVSSSAVFLTCLMPYNYYHWVLEALPRLAIYASAGIAADCVYAPVQKRFQQESLRLLGFPASRIFRATRNAHVLFDRLAISYSKPACNSRTIGSFCNSRTIDFLYHSFASHQGISQPKELRVFISRRKRGKREITNDDAVFEVLQPLGFKRYDLETMSVSEQVKLFYNAECVVGPHGAGLVNIAFCRQGTKVIEINTPYRVSTCFSDIAHYRGLNYQLHLATPDSKKFFNFDPKRGVGDSDMTVESAAFAEIVQIFLKTPLAADQSSEFKQFLKI